MKTLRDYIILEKLKLNKDIVATNGKIKIPVVTEDTTVKQDEIWETIEIPDGEWVIFRDQYRSNKLHFAEVVDFLTQVAICQEDYEDYNPDKVIVYSSDDFEDAFDWYCKKIGIPSNFKNLSKEELVDKFENIVLPCCDTEDFFIGVLSGEMIEDDFYDSRCNIDLKDIYSNFPEFLAKQYN